MTKFISDTQICSIFLCNFLILNSIGLAFSAEKEEIKYWISSNYQKSPNINTGAAEAFSPLILDPGLRLSKSKNSADVFICFDNRPLHESVLRSFRSTRNFSGNGLPYCEASDARDGTGYLSDGDLNNNKNIVSGITISRTSQGKIFCEAIFTVHSFLYFLGQENLYSLKYPSQLKIEPYTVSSFPYFSSQTKTGLLRHLNKSDRLETMTTVSGEVKFWDLSLNNTWSCLMPAFQIYWRTAFEKCGEGINELLSKPELHKITYNILQETSEKMLSITNTCRSNYK